MAETVQSGSPDPRVWAVIAPAGLVGTVEPQSYLVGVPASVWMGLALKLQGQSPWVGRPAL